MFVCYVDIDRLGKKYVPAMAISIGYGVSESLTNLKYWNATKEFYHIDVSNFSDEIKDLQFFSS